MGKEESFTLFDAIIFACFISLIFSPVGIFLMWWKTKWSKKIKIYVSIGFGVFFVLIFLLLFFLLKSPASGGGSGQASFGIEQGADGAGGGKKSGDYKQPRKSSSTGSGKKSEGGTSMPSETFIPKKTQSGLLIFILLLLLAFLIFVILRSKGNVSHERTNPYIDSTLYKFPIPDDFEFPPVRFTKFTVSGDEKILFAVPAETKETSGDILITNKRFLFIGRKGNQEFQLQNLTAISSISNTTLSLSSGEKTFYYIIHESQMRFVLQIVRYVYSKAASSGV